MCKSKLERPLHVCYFGTYRDEYSRNQIMIDGLRRNQVVLVACHEPLWRGIDDRVQTASGGWLKPAFLARIVRTYWRLLSKYRRIGNYDVMVLGYPGQLDVYIARLLTWLRRKPLVLDVFMSLYLIASERELTGKHRLTASVLYQVERLAYRLPDLLIQDTAEYVQWFNEHFGLAPDRFRLVPTGADDQTFQPVPTPETETGAPFRALYYGTFIPNHGVEYIIQAAKILADSAVTGIHLELIGEGPDKAQALAMVKEYGLTNVTFTGWVEKQELPARVVQADVCLGVFGTTPQSMMTVQNKIYEALAMGKPLLTGSSPTVLAELQHKEHVYLVRRAAPDEIAAGLLALQRDPDLRRRLARQGHELFVQQYAPQELGRQMVAHLVELITRKRAG